MRTESKDMSPDIAKQTSELLLSSSNKHKNPVLVSNIHTWNDKVTSDPKNRVVQQLFNKNPFLNVVNTKYVNDKRDHYLFNHEVDIVGSNKFANNQKLSGRCWIFAASNVLRTRLMKKYNIADDKFQLSQLYFYFYDKLEKCNMFLENVIATADQPLEDLYVKHFFQEPINDGGQWDMIVNLVNKYGAVPVEHFPDNAQATALAKINYVVSEKLREYGLILRKLVGSKATNVGEVQEKMIQQIHQILSLTLGTPPLPTDKFTWEFVNKDKEYKLFKVTPLEFFKDHVDFEINEYFSLINDPRNKYETLFTVDKLNNVADGKPVEYVNVEISDIKKAAIAMIKANEPIFFGCDVGKFSERKLGILDTAGYNYQDVFDTDLKMTKEERLRAASSLMTHAMVITGVHIVDDKPVRWKIQNSWGPDNGETGNFMMTDDWFDEYVYQIVTKKEYAGSKLYDIWKSGDYSVYPVYDPMGSLAAKI